MNRIALSKNERRLLRNIALGVAYWPDGMGNETLSACADSLERHGLIKAAWAAGHQLVSAVLTHHGAMYIQQNPRLLNPVDWKWAITTAIAAIAAIASIAALLAACSLIK